MFASKHSLSSPKIIHISKLLKADRLISLSYFKNNIYFRENSNVEKYLQKSKLDKKNVQFSKRLGLYQNQNFQKVSLHHNAHNTNFLIRNVL
jgi:hypothetical protein